MVHTALFLLVARQQTNPLGSNGFHAAFHAGEGCRSAPVVQSKPDMISIKGQDFPCFYL
jgi:hypothetical protein